MSAMTFQRYFAPPQPRAFCLAGLLMALLILPGCTNIAMSNEDMPAAGVDPAYTKLVATQLKGSFKDLASYDSFEISQPRWVQSTKGWSWLACVHFQDRGHRRTYAVFFTDGQIVDARYAVQTDACNALTYSPLDMTTAGLRPGAAGDPGPLY
jgi:hypothetical protein